MSEELGEVESAAAIRGLVRRANAARRAPLDFFNFAWREELRQTRVVATAHQRVYFKFIEAFPRCVVRMPPGYSKTTGAVVTGLYLTGSDNTSRGAFISAAEGQAYKPVSQMRDAIEFMDENYPEMRVVFPSIKRSTRPNDPWSKSSFTVDRPPGIRDATVTAYGLDSVKIIGSRLAWIVVDDILSLENTLTVEAREKTIKWFVQIVRDRLDPIDGRCVVTNVPYDGGDLTYYLEEKAGWPCLQMDAFGGIKITNTGRGDWVGPKPLRPKCDDWDCDDLRPSIRKGFARLAAHDDESFGAPLAVRNPSSTWQWAEVGTDEAKRWLAQGGELRRIDIHEEVPLWPARHTREQLLALEGSDDISKAAFDANYRMLTRKGSGKHCHESWITACKALAQKVGHTKQLDSWNTTAGGIVVAGVDIGGLGLSKDSDWSCIFVYELLMLPHHVGEIVLRPGTRRILRVKYGKWRSSELVKEIITTTKPFGAQVRIEQNHERSIREWIEEEDLDLEVEGHTTGMNKHHIIFGVEGAIFRAMEKGLWLIPNYEGECEPEIERWLQECRDHQPYPAHTGDGIMAAWMAVEQARSIWTPSPNDDKK